jgi:hypothetical protein
MTIWLATTQWCGRMQHRYAVAPQSASCYLWAMAEVPGRMRPLKHFALLLCARASCTDVLL